MPPSPFNRWPRLCHAALGLWLFGGTAAAAAAEFPSLEEAARGAEARALDVLDASGRLATARAHEVGARMSSVGNPYLEVSAGQQRRAEWEADARLFLPVEISGQRPARIREAESLVQARGHGVAEARARARGEATAAWGEARALAAKLQQTRMAEIAARRESEWIAAREQADAATVLDKSLAQAEASRWSQARAETDLALQRALARLSLLLGGGELGRPDPGEAVPLPPIGSEEGPRLLASVVERAPALRTQRAESAYWRAAGERARRERDTPVSLIVSGGRGDLGEPRLVGGIAWAFPVLRRNEGEIARAEAERARATSLAEALPSLLETRLRTTLTALDTAREALAAVDADGIPAAARFAEAAETSFRAGKIPFVQVIIARRDLANAQTRRLELVESMWRAYGDIVALTGETP